jgi:HAD superfamily hydrolase (TIGR01549 family)
MKLDSRRFWIFDLDGTLTRSVHDFQSIRSTLGLADGAPILESIAAMDESRQREAMEQVALWEQGLVSRAEAQPGAAQLLSRLRDRGARLGILTRNLCSLAHQTLDQVGLAEFFSSEDVLGRDSAAPKPSPDGIHRLLSQWRGMPGEAVMVGDYIFDAEAGKTAGASTVLVDPIGHPEWHPFADLVVSELRELLDHVHA